MAILQKTTKRACTACHAAKVKCVRIDGSSKCKRCERLGLKCVEHVSRQGQGTRRRKKVKTKVMKNADETVDEALAITAALSPVCNPVCNNNNVTPFCPTSGNIIDNVGPNPIVCPSSSMGVMDACPTLNARNCNGIRKGDHEDGLCSGMGELRIEDKIICKSIKNGLGRDHFGVNHLIRQWVSLAFSRRSFSLLARASFIAAKMNIPMDDIISNQSPFAAATDSQPMEHLSADILLPKGQRKTYGYPISLLEVPWDLLDSVQIDPKQPYESVRNRWSGIRWTSNGTCRYWTSPLFARDFATVEEIGKVWEENSNDKEVIDLFLPQSEKGKFAQELFNLLFVNNKPHMSCFVTKNRYKVQKRNNPDPIDVNVIQTLKILDLDSSIHYFEIQFLDRNRTIEHLIGDSSPTVHKRDHDVYLDNLNDDPIMGDGIAFTDIEMTDEMEEFLKLLGGEDQN